MDPSLRWGDVKATFTSEIPLLLLHFHAGAAGILPESVTAEQGRKLNEPGSGR